LKGVADTTFPVFNYDYPNRAAIPSNGANQFYDNTYQYDDNVSWQHGRNSFTFGVEARLQEFNIRHSDQYLGNFNFGSGQPAPGMRLFPDKATPDSDMRASIWEPVPAEEFLCPKNLDGA
jgi:hypothetical protein